MKKLLIDMDDVICHGAMLKAINTYLNTNYTYDDADGYYIQTLIPDDQESGFYSWIATQDYYSYSTIIDDAVEVIEELNSKYDIYICSAAYFPGNDAYTADLLKYKFEFLHKHFPFIDYQKFIFSCYKDIIKTDIAIDDRIENLSGADKKILFTAYHNKNISNGELAKANVQRASSWLEIKEMLCQE